MEVVPGTGAVEIRPLGTGLISATYRVVRNGVIYALKTAAERSPDLGLSFAWEAPLLTHASSLKLAPPLVYCDLQRAVTVSRWVAGRPWSTEAVHRPANLHRITELLRRVHALSVPAPPRLMSPLSWVDVYGAALARIGCPADTTLRIAADSRWRQLSRLPPGACVVCHSDLHRMNLIQDGEVLTLLDWEYAHVSDPSWDLAGWAANNDFEAQARRELLSSYLGAAPSEPQWMRLGLLMWLYDYVCLLWSELYLNTRTGGANEITRRATLLDARLRLPAHYWP